MLVLSLFPGIGLLDGAFEEHGFCVVRGPDQLWGGDIHTFHPPAGRFDGVIGGPPCQVFSVFRHVLIARGQQLKPNLIPEFERCVSEAQPAWFLMENVPDAPRPVVADYAIADVLINNRHCGGVQSRERRFSIGVRGDTPINLWRYIDLEVFEPADFEYAVTASRGSMSGLKKDRGGISRPKRTLEHRDRAGRRTVAECAVLQGLPADFLKDAPFTRDGKHKVIGNGVPLPMARAIAKAVKAAIAEQIEEDDKL